MGSDSIGPIGHARRPLTFDRYDQSSLTPLLPTVVAGRACHVLVGSAEPHCRTPRSPVQPLNQLSTALTGRYEIEREIGAGGMATVYLARDVRHARRVALKVLRPELGAVLGVD